MNRSFQRKVTYLALIAALLVPLSMIGRPAAVAPESGSETGGGKLSELRTEYKLGQAQLGKIDPTSSAVRYVSLGLHGVAVCVLQQKVAEYQKQEDWISLMASLKQLTYLQPYYVKVWEHQAWNVAYNISSVWDDYREKFYWVIRGFKLLHQGMDYNELEPGYPYWLGWYTGHKIGQADERREFRRLFSGDVDSRRLLVPQAAEGDAGWAEERDSWLYGKRYLRFAQDMVDRRGAVLRSMSPENFNIQVPMTQSKYAEALESEGVFGDRARAAWLKAHQDWVEFGEREFPSVNGYFFRMDSLKKNEVALQEAKDKFESLTPGLREKIHAEKEAALPEDQRRAWKTPEDSRTEIESHLAYAANRALSTNETEIAARVEGPKRAEAQRTAEDVNRLRVQVTEAKSMRKVYSYDYWLARSEMEQSNEALTAREYFYKALRDADDKPWEAKKTFEEAFRRWRVILDKYPLMIDDQTAAEVVDLIKAYQRILKQLDEPFDKKTFVLRDLMESNYMGPE
ncbi:MAG: hypothetical protein K8U03_21345 [Planctomycetia bacterium]|nr:hypothetical protein [Planctomycetia bacterium]